MGDMWQTAKCMNKYEELRNKQKSSLDYDKCFLKDKGFRGRTWKVQT